jgi:hypothetical protein
MVTTRFGVPKAVTMQDYLEKKEYLKRIKKQNKWQSVGGVAPPVSIGKIGLLPETNEGEMPEEVRVVKQYSERKNKGEVTPKLNVKQPSLSPNVVDHR